MKKNLQSNSVIYQDDLEFSTDASLAVLYNVPKTGKIITWILFFIVISFVIWAFFFEIDESIQAQGNAIPAGRTQVLQSNEGGIIESLKIHEGEQVKKGDTLIILKSDFANSDLKKEEAEYYGLLSKQIRIIAQLSNQIPNFPENIKKNHPGYIESQNLLYLTQKKALENKLKENKFKSDRTMSEYHASVSRRKDLDNQINLLEKEKYLNEPLVKKGAVAKTDILKFDQRIAQLNTELHAIIHKANELEIELERITIIGIQLQFEYRENLQKELAQVENILDISYEKTAQSKLKIIQKHIKAPVNGIVRKMYVNTIGGIAKPGEILIDIVPIDGEILVEAKVQPKDIGFISIGLPARIRISAYDFSRYGSLNGTITSVSADTTVDQKGHSFYLVLISINDSHFKDNHDTLPIIPGMQATIDISITQYSILRYIFRPALKLARSLT